MNKITYTCINCTKQFPALQVNYLCPNCEPENNKDTPPKGVLKTNYDFESLRKKGFNFAKLSKTNFIDLLPIKSLNSLPLLKVGKTPLYKIRKIKDANLDFDLFVKDDSQNPTYSFKDRASAIVSAYAKENAMETIVAASTGNAGSSLAGVCASQGQRAIILVPEKAPPAKLTQIVMYGANIIPVKGTYDDAFELSIKATHEFGWYNRNTAYNPLTIEGKKTVSFEIYEQFNQIIPDRIFVPVGDGVIISGVYKGFEDLLNLNIINKIPKIVAVQAKGSDNLTRNISNKSFETRRSNTIADSIAVDIPRNYYMARDYLNKYNGEWICVSDDDILDASYSLAQNSGLFAEPAAAAAYAGMLKFKKEKKLKAKSSNLVLLTGSGLKDIESIKRFIRFPKSIDPEIESLKKIIYK